jgi:hypothetical protein
MIAKPLKCFDFSQVILKNLMAHADTYQIKIKDLALFVRNVQLSPAVSIGHVNAL